MSVYLSCVVRMMMITHIFAVSTKVMLCHCDDGIFFLGCLTGNIYTMHWHAVKNYLLKYRF